MICEAMILVTRLFIDGHQVSVSIQRHLPPAVCEQRRQDAHSEVLRPGWLQVVTCEERVPGLAGEEET